MKKWFLQDLLTGLLRIMGYVPDKEAGQHSFVALWIYVSFHAKDPNIHPNISILRNPPSGTPNFRKCEECICRLCAMLLSIATST